MLDGHRLIRNRVKVVDRYLWPIDMAQLLLDGCALRLGADGLGEAETGHGIREWGRFSGPGRAADGATDPLHTTFFECVA
jgi:hypothetical protein